MSEVQPEIEQNDSVKQSPEGRVSRRLIAVAAAGAVALAGIGLSVSAFLNHLPEQHGTPEDSRIDAREIALVIENQLCVDLDVYDTSGSTARTVYSLDDTELSFTGYGAEMTEGKVVKEACVDGARIGKPADVMVDSQYKKVVNIPVTAISWDTHISTADTTVLPLDPPATQILGGAIDVASGVAKAACEGIGSLFGSPTVTIGGKKYNCDAVNIVSDWNHTNQVVLATALEERVMETVQTNCGMAGWDNERLAIVDSFRQQAKDQGADTNDVIVNFVDDKGRVTEALPDFKKNVWDPLYDAGILTENIPAALSLKFESITCTLLEGGYKPLYPDGYVAPTVAGTLAIS